MGFTQGLLDGFETVFLLNSSHFQHFSQKTLLKEKIEESIRKGLEEGKELVAFAAHEQVLGEFRWGLLKGFWMGLKQFFFPNSSSPISNFFHKNERKNRGEHKKGFGRRKGAVCFC